MKLTESELKSLLKIKIKRKDTLYGYCPKCGKGEFGISMKEDHVFGCFRKNKCGFTGNIYTLLKFLGIPIKSKRLQKFEGVELLQTEIEKESLFKFEILPEVKMPIGFKRVYSDDYLAQRGFLPQDFENYLCGHTNLDFRFKDRIIIGIKEGTRIIAYMGRALVPSERKYVNSTGTLFSRMMDGLSETHYDEVTIVEGLFDRLKVRNAFNSMGIKSRVVCSFGAKLSEYQIKILEKESIKRINLFFDPDVFHIIEKTSKIINHRFEQVNIMKINDLEKDPGSMSQNEIKESYENRINFIKFTVNSLPIVDLQ